MSRPISNICLKCNSEKDGRCKPCKSLYNKTRNKIDEKTNETKRHGYHLTMSSKYIDYKSKAKKRGYSFDLTIEQFATFWQKDCEYCGGSIATVGIDRVDNNKGYSLETCRACCSICNTIKLNHSVDFMNNHLIQMLKHQGLL